ncbi:MAG: hypothetical protein FWE53_01930 [Firmicutes bacterium]|nr:hypothetical protein [Bacillota bacterium]
MAPKFLNTENNLALADNAAIALICLSGKLPAREEQTKSAKPEFMNVELSEAMIKGFTLDFQACVNQLTLLNPGIATNNLIKAVYLHTAHTDARMQGKKEEQSFEQMEAISHLPADPKLLGHSKICKQTANYLSAIVTEPDKAFSIGKEVKEQFAPADVKAASPMKMTA